jgi:putative ribosome biogenesis GTPase RsgA
MATIVARKMSYDWGTYVIDTPGFSEKLTDSKKN